MHVTVEPIKDRHQAIDGEALELCPPDTGEVGGSEVDTKSPTGRMLLTMFAAVAEFERAIMLERQRVGVARARAEGKYRGRAPTARRQIKRVAALHGEGFGASAIAAAVGISRASVYRLLAEVRAA